MVDGSRNNPADVHRTSRTSLQFHCNPLGTTFHIQHRRIQTKVDKDTLATIEALNLTSAQRHTTNTEEYKNKPTRPHIPTTRNS